MSYGRIYVWTPDKQESLGGHVEQAVVPLSELIGQVKPRLSGGLVCVRNGGWVNVPGSGGGVRAVPIGDAEPDAQGNFYFEPGRGGGRMDKVALAAPDFRWRYIQASHFGEVNTYYHLHRIAWYVDTLLGELQAPPLPQVIAVVNAHHAATDSSGTRDGVRRNLDWLPFQGGHYRLPSRSHDLPEPNSLSPHGEIHLGPGRQLLTDGALVRAAGDRYRANASHNAGIIYHEYGHHITRHTADFRGNSLKPQHHQNNRKTSLDEGFCDYWAAAMLETPHIWAWHRRHDKHEVHPRSLVSHKTMDDFDAGPKADPHGNGTIWAAALWDLRTEMNRIEDGGARKCDLLVLKTLLLIGQSSPGASVGETRRIRARYSTTLATLLKGDEILYAGRHRDTILQQFSRRKILPAISTIENPTSLTIPTISGILRRIPPEHVPASDDLCSDVELESFLDQRDEPPLSVLTVGDIMLGDRTRKIIREEGLEYPFAGVAPLLQRSEIVFGNLEGPLAREAEKTKRNFSYRVNPKRATALVHANINVVTLANNHLTDCGRDGVLETLDALAAAGVASVGAGENAQAARRPSILQAGRWRVGFLGYYWNQRTAATIDLPGSAIDTSENLRADIGDLRKQVDRVVVQFHWGIPYQREPLQEDRDKARLAVDCGADVVVGHHPHVIQPMEIYRGCPILYSVGNFTFGSGNSLAEGLMVGFRFEEKTTEVQVYPIYVKNRDLRVNYQPKVLRGAAAHSILLRLAEQSGESISFFALESCRAILRIPKVIREGC